MTTPICVIAGAGIGNGAAFAKQFREAGYRIILLSRSQEKLADLINEKKDIYWQQCDLNNETSINAAFTAIKDQHGAVDCLVYNAGNAVMDNIESVNANVMEQTWKLNVQGCMFACQRVLEGMLPKGQGNIIIVGATASLKGGAGFLSFASAKAAQRSMAQSMARHLGPKGIHVAYLIIDGVIDAPLMRQFFPDKVDEFFVQPADIAQAALCLTQQAKSGWSFEVDLRPAIEKW